LEHDIDLDEIIAVAEFRSALRSFLRRTELIARDSGLTPQRYLLLLMIKGAADKSERATLTELVERLQLAESTVSELVARAEEIGLVERHRDPDDQRVHEVRLTLEGERRLSLCVTALEPERQRLRDAIEQAALRPPSEQLAGEG
jgi:DNA-binding MarR family transcriptional regulator